MFAEVMDGRQITLPSALLNQLEWKSGDKLDIFVENGELRLRGTEKAEKKRVLLYRRRKRNDSWPLGTGKGGPSVQGGCRGSRFRE